MDEVNGCRAAIYACDALLALAQNLANSAEQLAAAETNAYRKAELLDSAAILHHVPAHPARNFKEACRRSICSSWRYSWITAAMRLTRKADIALLPYFQRDINSGALNTQQAYEIVECLWFKLAELSEVRAACAIDGYPMLDAMLRGATLTMPK